MHRRKVAQQGQRNHGKNNTAKEGSTGTVFEVEEERYSRSRKRVLLPCVSSAEITMDAAQPRIQGQGREYLLIPSRPRPSSGINDPDLDPSNMEWNLGRAHKVLGNLGRNATSREIKMAYRLESRRWHPDHHVGKSSFKEAESRMRRSYIRRGNINPDKYAAPTVDATSSLLPSAGDDSGSGEVESAHEAPAAGGAAPQVTRANYATILTFIRGTLLGDSVEGPAGDNTEEGAPLPVPMPEARVAGQGPPTLRGFVSASGKKFDRKQYAAYKILCCSFLLGLVREGTIGNSPNERLGDLLGDLGNDPDLAANRNEIEALLVSHGAMDQLIMLVTGQGGSGKSTCVSLAQRFCHSFCTRLAILFDDKTFTFTSTTGSSAAIFGGTTVRSAAYLNRVKITDSMRKE
ncbi:hypothetical protein THAOC_29064 [Thalassiosira oceanica]|uniref:J domain-containing protein n=1 Tax=Thalassiosira oceanica TaxID=159749 RepID=K0REU6_THAOC|nr:hypothetical protein THAOC_29064 [Thalassiosira oceanica]|eukprot:EJK51740.1 hypothetical protein THAOC_29064 [Thalassiosira oceanica]